MGAVLNRVYDVATWTGNKIDTALDKINSLDGLDKVGSVVQAGIALYILKNGGEGAEGLKNLHSTIAAYKDIYEGKRCIPTIRDFYTGLNELRKKSFTQIREDFSGLDNLPTIFRSLIATTQKIAWPIITAITVIDLVGKFGGPSYNFVVTVFNGSTFIVGKVAGVTAIPVKFVLLTYALSANVFEHLCKLGDAAALTRKTNQKITLLQLDPQDSLKQARIAELQAKITQRAGELQAQTRDHLGINVNWLSNDYLTLVHQAAMLKILRKDANGLSDSLRNMTLQQFSEKKGEQYAQRMDDIWNSVWKSSMEIVSTGIKVAALSTNIGNIYLGVQTMSAIWGVESEWACKVVVEKVKLVGASVGLLKFLFVDGKPTEIKPANFTLAG